MGRLLLKKGTIFLLCLLVPLSAEASTFGLVSDVARVEGFAPVFTQGGFAAPIGLATAFGARVDVQAGDVYTITYQGSTVSLRPGDEIVSTPSGIKTLHPKPFLASDTLFVPLNLLADILRLRVSWNPATSVISLSPWTSILRGILSQPTGETLRESEDQPVAQTPPATDEVVAFLEPSPGNVTTVSTDAGEALSPATTRAGLEAVAASLVVPPAALDRVAGLPSQEGGEVGEGPQTPIGSGLWPEWHALTGVRIERVDEGGLTHFDFSAESPISLQTALLVDPYRLVIDIGGVEARDALNVAPLDMGGPVVDRIRPSYREEGLRIVFDMTHAVGHRVTPNDDGGVRLTLFRPFLGVSTEGGTIGGRIQFRVDGATEFELTRLVDPDRMVIDLLDTSLVGGPITVEPQSGLITRVRIAQFLPHVTRVVLDMARPFEVEAENGADGLTFAYGNLVAPITYRTTSDRGLDLRVKVDNAATIDVHRLIGPDRMVIDVSPMRLSSPLEPVHITDGPVYRLRASQFDEDTVRIVADLKFHVQYEVVRDGHRAFISFRQPDLAGHSISVDAGHGGIDVGAISAKYGLTEKEVNLDIALKLADLIRSADGGLHLTREDDVRIGESQRDGLLARVQEASASDTEVFISIHNNAVLNPSPSARGTETFFRSDDPASKELALAVQRGVVSALGTFDRGVIDNRLRGYFVLRYIEKPAILVEVAFLTDPEEEELLAQEWFRQRAAEGIFNGLLKYFHPDDAIEGSFVPASADEAWQRIPAG